MCSHGYRHLSNSLSHGLLLGQLNKVNYAMLLHIHKDKTDKLDLQKVAMEFIDVNDKRKSFFGKC